MAETKTTASATKKTSTSSKAPAAAKAAATKPAAAKAPAKAAVAAAPAKTAAAKPAAKKAPAGRKSAGAANVTPEQRYRMIQDAAYFRAERRGFIGGDPAHDWVEAEAEIDLLLKSIK